MVYPVCLVRERQIDMIDQTDQITRQTGLVLDVRAIEFQERRNSYSAAAGATNMLARIIHERFCCNRRSAALACEAQDGKSVSVSSHARYEIRFTGNGLSGGVATNRHE